MASDVFISHSRTSLPAAKKLAEALRSNGVSTWLDAETVSAGEDWRGSIRDALDRSRAIVFLIEPGRDPGPQVRNEWSEALEAAWDQPSKRLIPVLIKDAEVPPFLGDRRALRVAGRSGEWERAAQEIAAALRDDAGAVGEVVPAARDVAKRDLERRLQEIEVAAGTLWPRE